MLALVDRDRGDTRPRPCCSSTLPPSCTISLLGWLGSVLPPLHTCSARAFRALLVNDLSESHAGGTYFPGFQVGSGSSLDYLI